MACRVLYLATTLFVTFFTCVTVVHTNDYHEMPPYMMTSGHPSVDTAINWNHPLEQSYVTNDILVGDAYIISQIISCIAAFGSKHMHLPIDRKSALYVLTKNIFTQSVNDSILFWNTNTLTVLLIIRQEDVYGYMDEIDRSFKVHDIKLEHAFDQMLAINGQALLPTTKELISKSIQFVLAVLRGQTSFRAMLNLNGLILFRQIFTLKTDFQAIYKDSMIGDLGIIGRTDYLLDLLDLNSEITVKGRRSAVAHEQSRRAVASAPRNDDKTGNYEQKMMKKKLKKDNLTFDRIASESGQRHTNALRNPEPDALGLKRANQMRFILGERRMVRVIDQGLAKILKPIHLTVEPAQSDMLIDAALSLRGAAVLKLEEFGKGHVGHFISVLFHNEDTDTGDDEGSVGSNGSNDSHNKSTNDAFEPVSM